MKFNVKGDSARPSAKGSFFSPLNSSSHTDSLFVNPSPISSRCNATWVCTMNVQGNISLNNETSEPKPGIALLMSSRGYYKQRNKSTIAWGIGTVKNQEIIFQLGNSNLDSTDPDKYNSNILVVNGKKTALPSVVITHPFGYDKNWIIQDTESMIDLTFTPSSLYSRKINLIFMQTNYSHIYGIFEGVLLTMLDARTTIGYEIVEDVRKFFKEKVFNTIIPRLVRLVEAPSHGKPINIYDSKSAGADGYRELAREVIERGEE